MSRPENVKWVDVSANKLLARRNSVKRQFTAQLKTNSFTGPPRLCLRSRHCYAYYARVLSRSYEASFPPRTPAKTLPISVSASVDTRPDWSGDFRLGDRICLRPQTNPTSPRRRSKCYVQFSREECFSTSTATYTSNSHSNNIIMVHLSIGFLSGGRESGQLVVELFSPWENAVHWRSDIQSAVGDDYDLDERME